MTAVMVIPARFASKRYPGKPLAALRQADGSVKSLIHMSWEAASRVSGIDEVYLATDDDRIAQTAIQFGAKVVMTSETCENGTARCTDALRRLDKTPDLVINFQGDAPLTPPWFVEDLIEEMKRAPDVVMATPVLRCEEHTYSNFVEDRKVWRIGGITVVFDRQLSARDRVFLGTE